MRSHGPAQKYERQIRAASDKRKRLGTTVRSDPPCLSCSGAPLHELEHLFHEACLEPWIEPHQAVTAVRFVVWIRVIRDRVAAFNLDSADAVCGRHLA